MHNIDVTLLLLGPPSSDSSIEMMRLSEVSLDLGVCVKISTNPLELTKIGTRRRPSVLIVDGFNDSEYDAYALISVLRCTQDTGIIMLVDDHSDFHRRAYRAGADICLSCPVDPQKFRSSLHTVARRFASHARDGRPHASEQIVLLQADDRTPRQSEVRLSDISYTPAWRLSSKGWRLRTPDGATIALTASERLLLRSLFGAQRETVGHDELLAQQVQAGERVQTLAALSNAISRLKKKCLKEGAVLPVLSCRNVGYRFGEKCTVED